MSQSTCLVCERVYETVKGLNIHRSMTHGLPPLVVPCSIDGCDDPKHAEGYCGYHYRVSKAKGDPLAGSPRRIWYSSHYDRFMSKVDRGGPVPDHDPSLGPCHVWTGGTGSGYGRFRVGDISINAHRWIYEHTHGPVGDLMICHRCDNRACVNIDHLYAGRSIDNVHDMMERGPSLRRNARLTPAQVRAIRWLCGEGAVRCHVAEMFGVWPSAVSHIMTGRNWGDLP